MKPWDIVGLLKTKTFLLAVGAIIAAITSYANGAITLETLIAAVIYAIQTINQRDTQLTIQKQLGG